MITVLQSVPTKDSSIAQVLRAESPHLRWCLRCGFPHSTNSTPHRTVLDTGSEELDGTPMYLELEPLCEVCWGWLETPEARWPYYAWGMSRLNRPDELWWGLAAALAAGR